jgi:antitoxin CptB
MLENDLLLGRFLDARGAALTDAEADALDRLLDLADDELWDLLAGRAEAGDRTYEPLVRAMRSM